MALTQILPGMLSTASVLLENFSATGSASSDTYLRGDNSWAVVPRFNINTVTDQALFTTSSVIFANLTVTNTATFASSNIKIFQDGSVSRIVGYSNALSMENSGYSGVIFPGSTGVIVYNRLAAQSITGYGPAGITNTGTNFPYGFSATTSTFNIVKVKNQIELGDSTANYSRLIMTYNTLTQGISMTNFPGYGGGDDYNGINIGNYTGKGTNTTILGHQGLQGKNIGDTIAIGYRAGKGLSNTSQNNNTIIGNIITDQASSQSNVYMTDTLLVAAGPDGVDNQRIRIGTDRIILGKNAFTATIAANSIVLNASNNTLITPNSGLFVDPITNSVGTEILFYNTATKEITYSNTSTTQVGYAKNILGNGVYNGSLLYQSAPNTTGFLGQGLPNWIMVSNGEGNAPSFNNTGSIQVGYAKNILGNGAGNGSLLYQDSPNTTGFLGQGSAGWLLVSYGSGQNPRFSSTGSIYVNSSVNTENLRGGSDYAIPYQRVLYGESTTNYISSSTTASTYLSWTGSGYDWTIPPAFNISTITNQALFTTSSVVFATVSATTGTFNTIYVGTSTNTITWNPFVPLLLSISGTSVSVGAYPTLLTLRSTTGESSLSSGGGTLTLNNSGFNYSGSTSTFANLTVSNTATITNLVFGNTSTTQVGFAADVLGGVAGQLLYQVGANDTGFINTGSVYVGNAAQANILNPANTATQQVGFAADVLGGVAGQLLYQIGPNDTGFINTGSVYVGNAAQANILNPANTATQQVGFAADVLGGAANQIHYQISANDTGFIAAPTTATTYLAWTGTNYVWQTVTIPDVISPFLLGCL